MRITELQDSLHRKILDLRAVENIIKTPKFERLYADSDHETQYEVTQYIMEGRKIAVRNWMACHPSIELEELSHNRLKDIGKRYSIPNWSRLQRWELVAEINKKEEML